MRIISGYLKGRKLLQPESDVTRPLKDLTKESIFNIIQHSGLVKKSFDKISVLDFFAGVGSFGLECVSRGSRNIKFFENHPQTIKILEKNIINLKCEDYVEILKTDILKIQDFQSFFDKKFEIIFMDPPYKENNTNLILDKIINSKILKRNGIIIIHRHKKSKDLFPKKFNIKKVKNYGISKIIFGN